MEMTIRLSHAGSALTAGLCCIGGRTMSLFSPSVFPWTIVGSADALRAPGSRQKRKFSFSLCIVQVACKQKYPCKHYIFFDFIMGNKSKIKHMNRSTHPRYNNKSISWQSTFGSKCCSAPQWPELKVHFLPQKMVPCIIPNSSLHYTPFR